MLIKNLLYNLNKNNLLNIDKLENNIDYSKNLYESIDSSSSINKFIYLFIIIFSFYIFNKITIKLNNIFGIIFSSIIILLFIQYTNKNIEIDDKDFKYKLKYINNNLLKNNYLIKSNFHKFTLFIDFLYDIKKYSKYSSKVYQELLNSTNTFLKIYLDINNNIEINKNKELATKYFKLSMNNYQSLIYSTPSNESQLKYFNDKMKIFYNIFQIYLKDINLKSKEEFDNNPITNESVIPETNIVYAANDKKLNSFDVF